MVAQYIVQTTMLAEGTVSDYTPAKLTEMEAVLAAAAGVSAPLVTIAVASGSVILTAKILVDSPTQQATVNSDVAAALGTPSAPSNIFASVSGGGVTINTFSVANTVEQRLVAPPATPPISPIDGDGDNGWIAGVVCGPLGLLFGAIGTYTYYKQKKQGGSGTSTASANVQMHKTENV